MSIGQTDRVPAGLKFNDTPRVVHVPKKAKPVSDAELLVCHPHEFVRIMPWCG